MQRAGLESILGVRLAAGSLYLDPCLPKDWRRVDLTLRYGAARYEILVDNREGIGRGVVFAALDGREVVVRPLQLALVNDGAPHRLDVRIG
jgi:cyclic beta-1,2-glucan synthetase